MSAEKSPPTMPPVAPINAQDAAMRVRRTTLKKLNELATPELRKWVVACLADDIEKANA